MLTLFFEYFIVFLKNRNFISKIRKTKVTNYAARYPKRTVVYNCILL